MSFIQNCKRALTKQPAENNFCDFVVMPFVQGASKKIGRILKPQKVKVAYEPQLAINSLLPCPKELHDSDRQKSGIVYKFSCTQCNFVYYGQTERSLKTRIADYKKAVAGFDQNSKVAGHVQLFGHNTNFENVKVVSFESTVITMSDFSSKPGTLHWTLMLETIIPYFQKTTKASRQHELHGHARKFHVTLL